MSAMLRKNMGRFLVTVAMVGCAFWVGQHLWDYYVNAPWTRDGRVSADVVSIAPEVSGTVQSVAVIDNQFVHKGDLLFQIDRERFRFELDQASAHP